MKTVRVVAAVLFDTVGGEEVVFATARGYGAYKGLWEFPGGKIEPGEIPEEALKREINEELDTEVSIGEKIITVEYDYPDFHLSMDCFRAHIMRGHLILKEAEASRWLKRSELDSVPWLPADLEIVSVLKKSMNDGLCDG